MLLRPLSPSARREVRARENEFAAKHRENRRTLWNQFLTNFLTVIPAVSAQ
jgi:hypothetical protein